MPKIEIDPLCVPQVELLDHIAPRLEESLQKRNSFFEEESDTSPERDYAVSKTIVLPSNYLQDQQARNDLFEEHQEHLENSKNLGIDANDLRRTTLMGNLLTERDLPQYVGRMMMMTFQSTEGKFPESAEPLVIWQLLTWPTEEHFHIDVLRDIGIATGELDLQEFDRKVIKLQTTDLGIEPESLVELWSYLAPQEADTVPSHDNTAKLWSKTARMMMEETARNEATHKKVNIDLLKWSMEVDADHTVQALWRQFRNFSMPGEAGIEGYDHFKTEMGVAGLLDFVILRKVHRGIVKQLGLENVELTGRSADYRDQLMKHLDDENPRNIRIDNLIEAERERRVKEAAKNGNIPFILDRTVVAPYDEPMQLKAA